MTLVQDGGPPRLAPAFHPSGKQPAPKSHGALIFDWITVITLSGLLLLPFQVVQISTAQVSHIWMLAALTFIALTRSFYCSRIELITFAGFVGVACVLTFFQDYPRIKQYEQVLKFILIYPGFYFVGRWIGAKYQDRDLPLGYGFLFAFLGFQFIVQSLSFPIIYKEIDFGQGSLHGTFKERNWLAVYFLLFSYFLLLKSPSPRKFIPFFLLNGIVMVLSGSKTAFVACGLIFLLQSRVAVPLKLVAIVAGAFFYITVFSQEFSEEKIQVRLEEERGLAFQASIELIENNPIGYGFGFVESYFATTGVAIRGLGEGANSVFAVPLDAFVIAGIAGIAFWLVFFAGVGNGAVLVLLPIAALSLLNPLHQSETIYLFIGALASHSRLKRWRAVRTPPLR